MGNPEHVMFSVTRKLGRLDFAQFAGERYAMNMERSKKESLLCYRVESEDVRRSLSQQAAKKSARPCSTPN